MPLITFHIPISRRAFTLVELLVVIAIIGLLSTIAAVSLNSTRSKARDTKRQADIKQIITAMQLYYDAKGKYPDASTPVANGGLGCSCGSLALGACCLGHGDGVSCWNGNYHGCKALDDALSLYIAKIPDDPENAPNTYGDAYTYYDASLTGGWVTVGPGLHWGYDQVSNSNNCLGGVSGQWVGGGPGKNRYWCALTLTP